MRCLLYGMIMLSSISICRAQVAAEDAKGETSIIYKGSSLGLGITDASLSVNWNNLHQLAIQKEFQVIWGLSASAKNQDGLGDLLKTGRLNPESKAGGLIALRWVQDKKTFELLKKRKESDKFVTGYIRNQLFAESADSIITFSELRSTEKSALKNLLKPVLEKSKIDEAITEMGKLNHDPVYARTLAQINAFLQHRKNWLDNNRGKYNEASAQKEDYNAQLSHYREATPFKAHTFYLDAGLSASKFNLYDPAVAVSLSARMDTTKFSGSYIDLGWNRDFGGRWTLGLSAGYERTNNLDSLTLKDYSIKTSEKLGSEEISSSQAYKAYPGTYFAYNRSTIKFDVLYYAKLDEDYRLVWNVLYGRVMIPFSETRIRTVFNSGTALTVYKSMGKLSGGVYFQSDDVFNNTGTGDSFAKRLGFGLIAKFNFDSIRYREN